MIGRAFAAGRPVAPLPRRGTDAGAPLDRDEYNGSEALPNGLRISGFVYDVATGQIERVVAPPGQAAPQG
jgi:hypothetical protein